MESVSVNNRHRAVWSLLFSLIVLLGLGSVASATDPPASSAQAPNQATLLMLAKIAAAGASGQFETAEQLFRQGKEAGLSELQMYEAVLNLLPYIGYPRTISTMTSFQKVYPHYIRERSGGGEPQPTEPWQDYAGTVWVERGTQIQQQLGFSGPGAEELARQITLLSPELAEWVRYDDFGRVFGRAGLSLLEREAIVIGVLVAQGAPQIAAHHRAILRVGGSEALVDALVEAVADLVDEKALAAARQYIAEVRKR
ncbi:MAG: carboxymuconolactone decarboxylase family protein [Candidatus Binatia bacterium]|nr:carboxymuconolactone decarboxylase family protein [Candidatus Binatia bacterium]